MKNIFKKIFFSVLVTCLFISCSDFSNSDSSFVTNEKGRIIISTNLDSQSRSVLPTGITEQTQGLTWELVGTCEEKTYSIRWNDTTSEDGSVTSTAYNNMKNDNDLLLDVGTWLFSLKVKNNNGYVLVGTTQVAINSGENTLSFVMNEATSDDLSDGETVASGSIEFTLKFPGDVVTKGIATLTPLAGGNSLTKEFTADAATSNQFLSSITYENENISAGYYILKIQLQQEGDATTPAVEYINTYSCLIRVTPGLTSYGVYTLDKLAQLYTVTYKLNEGTFDSTTSAVPTSYNAYTSFALPTPTREGYEFVGWYTDETYDTPASNDGTYKISTDTTLYAKWVEAVSGITHANNTLYISSYEGLKIFRDIVNGSLESNITIPANAANSGESVTCNAGTPVTTYNAELQSNITIDEDWTPIGVYTNASSQVPYVGEFKGNNNTITFDDTVSINSQAAGLFGAISDGCKISNLIIEGNIVYSSDSSLYAGGIVGYATGGSVLNCVNRAKIQGTCAGGIAGKTQSTSFNGCVNFGEINGTNYSAGIVGSAAADTSINLCINVGTLTSSATACGISGDAPSNIIVQNCINLGTLSAGNFIYGISSGSGTISSNISAGKFEGTVQNSCYAVSYSASNTNYYDNSIYSSFSPVTNVEGKPTSEFSNWNPDELAWLAAEGRYPLPNISENVDAGIQAIPDEIWNEIYDAAAISVSEPIEGTSVANETDLIAAISNTSVDTIIINGDFEISNTIKINRNVTIKCATESTYILTKTNGTNGPMFEVSSSGDVAFENLIFSGGYDSSLDDSENNPFIYNNGKTEVKNSVLKDNFFYYSGQYIDGNDSRIHFYGGGAIYSSGNLVLNNVEIDNIYGSVSSTYGGGGIYINAGTCNANGLTIQNCISTAKGGGIYIYGGSITIENSLIIYNKAGTNGEKNGGGICVDASGVSISIKSSQINNNTANLGKSIYIKQGSTYTINDNNSVTVTTTSGCNDDITPDTIDIGIN